MTDHANGSSSDPEEEREKQSRTLIERIIAGGEPLSPQSLDKTQWDPTKTVIDIESCKIVLANLVKKTESKLQNQPNTPVSPKIRTPIERFKLATPCPSTWEEMSGTDNTRFCKRCLLRVYDFQTMTEPEAEQLIFRQEGLHYDRLYKRADGRFLTRDCPVAVASRLTVVTAIAVGLASITALMAILMSMPKSNPSPDGVASSPRELKQSKAPTITPASRVSAPGALSGGNHTQTGTGKKPVYHCYFPGRTNPNFEWQSK